MTALSKILYRSARPFNGVRELTILTLYLLIPTDDVNETELLFGLNALAGYAFEGGVVQTGLSTITLITEEDLDFSERLVESIVLSGEFGRGNVRPGLVLRIPLDSDLSALYNVLTGVSVGVLMGS